MALKLISLEEKVYIPLFDRENTKDPVKIHYKPLNKENWDRYVALVKMASPNSKLVSYDAADANKFLWKSAVTQVENILESTFTIASTREQLDFLYERCDPQLLNEILNEITNASTLSEKEIKNSELVQGSPS